MRRLVSFAAGMSCALALALGVPMPSGAAKADSEARHAETDSAVLLAGSVVVQGDDADENGGDADGTTIPDDGDEAPPPFAG